MVDQAFEQGARIDISVPQGGTFSQTFQYLEDDAATPVPIDSYTSGRCQIRKHPGGDLLGEMTLEVNTDTSEVTISMSAAETAALPAGGFYDIALIHEDNETVLLPFVQGRVILDRRVTVIEDE